MRTKRLRRIQRKTRAWVSHQGQKAKSVTVENGILIINLHGTEVDFLFPPIPRHGCYAASISGEPTFIGSMPVVCAYLPATYGPMHPRTEMDIHG